MGFFNSVVGGLKKGVTGGDGKMDLSDYLKLGGMAASAATGNVPGMVALGASMAGDATGSKELSMAGDIASIAAGGVGAANALSGGVGAVDAATGAADVVSGLGEGTGAALQAAGGVGDGMGALASAAEGSSAVMSPLADSASLLEAGAGFSPEAIQGLGSAGNVFDAGGAVPPELASGGGGSVGQTLKNFLGNTKDERMQTGYDMAGDAVTAYQEQNQGPEAAPQEWQQTEDIMNYIPTYMTALKDYLSQAGVGGNQYTGQFNQYGG